VPHLTASCQRHYQNFSISVELTTSSAQLLPKQTYSNQVIIEPIAKSVNFAILYHHLQIPRCLGQTIEADLNYRNVEIPKAVLEYSVNQLDFSFVN
jgi:hypothetical protein